MKKQIFNKNSLVVLEFYHLLPFSTTPFFLLMTKTFFLLDEDPLIYFFSIFFLFELRT